MTTLIGYSRHVYPLVPFLASTTVVVVLGLALYLVGHAAGVSAAEARSEAARRQDVLDTGRRPRIDPDRRGRPE